MKYFLIIIALFTVCCGGDDSRDPPSVAMGGAGGAEPVPDPVEEPEPVEVIEPSMGGAPPFVCPADCRESINFFWVTDFGAGEHVGACPAGATLVPNDEPLTCQGSCLSPRESEHGRCVHSGGAGDCSIQRKCNGKNWCLSEMRACE